MRKTNLYVAILFFEDISIHLILPEVLIQLKNISISQLSANKVQKMKNEVDLIQMRKGKKT